MFNSVVLPVDLSVVLAKFWRFRTIAAVMLACSACKPLLSTDSSPASPDQPLANQAIALAKPFSQSGISLSPPAQWQSVKIPGLKYAAFVADPTSSTSSNISLMEDQNPLSLENYINNNLKELKTAFPSYGKFQRTTFMTQVGMTGVVVSTESQQLGITTQQRFYFFAPNSGSAKVDRKLVAVCTGTSQIEAICNASIKTLRVTP